MATEVKVKIAPRELAKIKSEVTAVVSAAKRFKLTTVKNEERALEILRQLKNQLKLVEGKRTSITKPLNQSLRATNTLFKEIAAPLKQADAILRAKVMEFREEQERKALAEQTRRENIQQSHVKRGHEAHELEKVQVDVGSSVVQKRWTFNVVDLKKVPVEFLLPNSVAINAAIREGRRKIAGLEIFQSSSLSVR